MEIAIWDTYCTRFDQKLMHFDILVPSGTNREKVIAFGEQYLKTKSFDTKELGSQRCLFCHVESATQQTLNEISLKGYDILEMENCII